MAHPNLCTPERVDELCKAAELGATRAHAAQYAGITRATLQEWLRSDKPLHVAFAERYREAEAHGKLALLATIRKASSKQWQAAAWMLERTWPNEYGRRERVEVTGAAGGPVQLAALSDDALRRLAAEDPQVVDAKVIEGKKGGGE